MENKIYGSKAFHAVLDWQNVTKYKYHTVFKSANELSNNTEIIIQIMKFRETPEIPKSFPQNNDTQIKT